MRICFAPWNTFCQLRCCDGPDASVTTYSAAPKACGIAPGAPIGGCDPPHATKNAAAALALRTWRTIEVLIALLSKDA